MINFFKIKKGCEDHSPSVYGKTPRIKGAFYVFYCFILTDNRRYLSEGSEKSFFLYALGEQPVFL